nr:transposase (putative), gypsy type [Tanacetum cinerariifolium]
DTNAPPKVLRRDHDVPRPTESTRGEKSPEDMIVDFPEGKQEAWEKYPAMLHQALRFPKKLEQSLLLCGRKGVPDYCGLTYECSKRWDAGREYVKTGSRPRAAHEVPLLTVTANRVIEMEDPAAATDSSGAGPAERVVATGPPAVKERRKRGHDGVDTNAPPKVLRRDHDVPRPTESTRGEKSCATRSPKSIYRLEWGITNGCQLDVPEACQDLVDHIAPPGYFLKLRHLHNDEFLKQYNVNLARQVAMGPRLRLRFEQEAKLLRKSVAQVTGEENLKAAFEEFKRYEDNRVEQRCAEMDARMDALSIDFNKELYPRMLTAIAGRRWMIGRELRLAVMKCGESIELRQALIDVVSARIAKGMSEGLKHGVEHGKTKVDLEVIEAYDSEAKAKYIAALHALKNLKYPLVDQLESLKDAPIDVIMASLHLKSDTGDDASQWIRELLDAIVANISRAEKKKKCRVVCRTHGVGSAHHARFDGVLVSVPTVSPQGLAILLANAATQTETSDEASPRLLRSSSLPVIHG